MSRRVRTIVKIAVLTAATMFAFSVLPAQQNTPGTATSANGKTQTSSDAKFKQEFGPTQASKKQDLVQNSGNSKHGAVGQANPASTSSKTSTTSSTPSNHGAPAKAAASASSSTSSK